MAYECAICGAAADGGNCNNCGSYLCEQCVERHAEKVSSGGLLSSSKHICPQCGEVTA